MSKRKLAKIAKEIFEDYFEGDTERTKEFLEEHLVVEIVGLKQSDEVVQISKEIKRWTQEELKYYEDWDGCFGRYGLTDMGKLYITYDRLDEALQKLVYK